MFETSTPRPEKSPRHALRPVARALALEPRLLFDGAGAVAAADHFDAAGDHAAEAHKQDTQPAAEARPSEAGRNAAGMELAGGGKSTAGEIPLLDLADSAAPFSATLSEAARLALQSLESWLQSGDHLAQAAEIFSADAGSAAWNANFQALREEILSGRYDIRVEARTAAELQDVLGAYSTAGSTGERTLYLNADWLAQASAEQVAAVLLEEIGHDFDDRLNGGKDSAGDEGHAFASLLATGDANLAVNLGRDDHRTLVLDGREVQVENAGQYSIAQIHYVPMPEDQINKGIANIATTTDTDKTLESIIAITATSNKTVIVYDHWEDGYEANMNDPDGYEASTKAWTYTDADGWFIDTNRDGIKNNGEAAVANGTTIVASGRTLILRNQVTTAHAENPANGVFHFDGRDKIGSTKAVTITRAGWGVGIGTVVGGAVNLIDAGNAGQAFVIPVGTNTTGALFEKTSLFIMAYADGTEIEIDVDGDGNADITRTLDEGDSLFVQGKFSGGVDGAAVGNAAATINPGTKVTADKAIGVNVLAGKSGKDTQNRWYSLAPTESWGSSYYAPVATVGGAVSDVYLYNNNGSQITVKYDTLNSSGVVVTNSVNIAANSGARVQMGASAAHFYTDNNDKFYAVASVDRTNSRDWSYTLVAEKTLTDRFVVAWGPGNSDDNIMSYHNGSPVWVTSTEDTWLYVDSATVKMYSAVNATAGAGNSGSATPAGVEIVKDATLSTDEVSVFRISKLQSYRIFDTSDKDQTGLTVYTTDGTLLTAAWGQDRTVAGSSTPYLDMGTTVSPQPDYLIQKGAAEAATATYGAGVSNDNGLIELGEQVEYTITISNRAVIDLFNVNIKDEMSNSTSGTYVENSASLQVLDENGVVLLDIPDFDGDDDIFPLLGGGYTLIDMNSTEDGVQGLAIGSRIVVTYRVTIRGDIDSVLADDNYSVSNSVTMSGQPPVGDPIDPKTVTVNTKVSTIVADAQTVAEDATISKTFKVTNTEGLTKIVIASTDVSLAQLQGATSGSPVVINTPEGALKITNYSNDPVTKIGTITYTYDPDGTSKTHNAANDPVQDTVTLVAHIGAGTVSTNLVIDITDTAPTANDDARTLAHDTATALPGNVYASGGAGDVADISGGDTTTLTHIGVGAAAPTAAVTPGSTSSVSGTSVNGTYGTLVIGADGSYTYDLDEAMNAVATLPLGGTLLETFSYRITDSDGDESTALLTISIRNAGVTVSNVTVNETDSYAVFEVNFTDKITLELIDGTAKGGTTSPDDGSVDYHTTMEYSEDGSTWHAYTPASQIDPPLSGKIFVRVPIVTDSNYEGSETFQLKVTDEHGKTDTGTGTIVDQMPNDVPTARNDSFDTTSGTPVGGSLADNDTLGDGSASQHTWSKKTDPANGTVTVNPDGSFSYTPHPGFSGTDSFTYTVTDRDGDTSTATVTITVNGVPVAKDDAVMTPPGKPVSGTVSGNDTPSPDGGNVWTKITDPTNGTVTLTPDGGYTYTPNEGFSGTDTFTYTVTDKDGDTSMATVTIRVTGVPVAVDDSATTKPGTPVSGSLGGNDTPSPDGGNVWSKTSDPANGTVTVSPDGNYTYTPNPDFSGTDSFTYTVTDKDGDKSTATVTITVGSGNTPGEGEVDKPNPDNPELVDPNANGQRNVPPPAPISLQPIEPGEGPRLQPEAPLQQRNTLGNSPIILDAGPYFAGERHDDVRRMNLPFHPIVYVNREVVVSQNERAQDDTRMFSQPGMATPGDIGLRSQGAGLGQDHNLFVVHSVRDSQQQAGFLGGAVDGRLGRVQLNSDASLPGPDLGQPGAGGAFAAPAGATGAAEADERAAAGETGAESSAPRAEVDEDEADEALAAAATPDFPRVAPSFAEQLRSGAGRLPLAAHRA